jgi:methylglutaconyl-CoA hydratase
MENENVLYQQNGEVATLTLNRPEKRNAFDDATIARFTYYLNEIQQNNEIRILVIRGNGEHFCAGGDIDWMKKTIEYSPFENYQDAIKLAELMHLLFSLNKPTIALIQGGVYGGGTGLVACADIVLAEPETIFCFSEVKLGLVPAVISVYILKAIGLREAKRYMITAEPFNAKKALDLGLIHEITPPQEREDRLNFFIEQILNNGPHAVKIAKKMLLELNDEHFSPESYKEYTAEIFANTRTSDEAQLGFTAFLEKRKPNWEILK